MEINIKNCSLFYEEYGEGIPVICLHGFEVDHRLMKGCIEPVFQQKEGFHRIYPDLPGMGRSSSAEGIKTADDMLDIVGAFIDELLPETRFVLAAQSYGGYLSMGLLHKWPSRIIGLFLICPCMIADHAKRTLPEKKAVFSETIKVGSRAAAFDDFKEMAVVLTNETWKRYLTEILPGIQISDQRFLRFYAENGYAFSFEPSFHEVSYDGPAVFLLGKQDHVVGYADALIYEKQFEKGSFAVIDGAGHNLQIERPNLFSAYLEDFLQRVSQSLGRK